MEHFDVLVAGGGSAGLAAAVSAARMGAKTLLIERLGTLGGMASASLIHSICGLYYLPDYRQGKFCNPGFASEFALRLLNAGNARGPVRMGKVEVLLHSPFGFACLADQIAQETPNLEVRLHCDLIGCSDSRRPPLQNQVEICCRGNRSTIEARSFVDASGDGVLAALSGVGFEREPSQRLQRPAYIFSMQNVPWEAVTDHARLRIARLIAGAVIQGNLERGALGAGLRAGCKPGEIFVTIDLAAPGDYDPTSSKCLTQLEMEGRRLASQISDCLIHQAPGFEKSNIAAFPARIGVRESRQVLCEYMLQEQDLLAGARFEDAVALATWPMELREKATGPKLRYPQGGVPCPIPLRSLRARGSGNFFVAGRCMGASHEAQASTRVIGTCFATGESAGIAAALYAQGAEVTAAGINAGRNAASPAHAHEHC